MDHITGQPITDLVTAKSVIDDIIKNYCLENELDEKDINPCIWDDIIQEIYIQVFQANRKLLKTESALNNEYDKSKVLYCYENIYLTLSLSLRCKNVASCCKCVALVLHCNKNCTILSF